MDGRSFRVPRFFFNVCDGVTPLDSDGTELPNAEVAKVEAIRHAGVLVSESADRFRVDESWRLEVTDEAGLILYRIEMHIGSTAATMHLKNRRRWPSASPASAARPRPLEARARME